MTAIGNDFHAGTASFCEHLLLSHMEKNPENDRSKR
jgi:hypothetical protein